MRNDQIWNGHPVFNFDDGGSGEDSFEPIGGEGDFPFITYSERGGLEVAVRVYRTDKDGSLEPGTLGVNLNDLVTEFFIRENEMHVNDAKAERRCMIDGLRFALARLEGRSIWGDPNNGNMLG